MASCAAEMQEQVVQHLVDHPAAQRVTKKSPARPRSQQGRSSYTQNDPEADRAAALQAQQRAAELSQELRSETRVSKAGIAQPCIAEYELCCCRLVASYKVPNALDMHGNTSDALARDQLGIPQKAISVNPAKRCLLVAA